MKKIQSLTKEQLARLPEFAELWTKISLCTDPAIRSEAEAEAGVIASYRAAGLPAPKNIVWCGSPLSQGLTRSIVFGLTKQNPPVRPRVRDAIVHSAWDALTASVSQSLRDYVRAVLSLPAVDVAWNSMTDFLVDSVWGTGRASVTASASVRQSMRGPARNSVTQPLRESFRDAISDSVYGQNEAGCLAIYDYFARVCGLSEETRKLTGLCRTATSAGWWLPHQDICWISERPTVLKRDERGRLHCETGPAMAYPDGWSIYAWHGVRVDRQVIEQPATMTTRQIELTSNAEVRRVMIQRYGFERFVRDARFKVVQRDDFGTLYRRALGPFQSTLCFVEVVNSTPEPDGTFKRYMIPCRASVRTAHEAVARSFGLETATYHPSFQS